MRRLIALAIAAAALAASGPARAGTTESGSYAGFNLLAVAGFDDCETSNGLGMVCFDGNRSGLVGLDVAVTDVTGLEQTAEVRLYGPAGYLTSVQICGTARVPFAPTETLVRVVVHVGGFYQDGPCGPLPRVPLFGKEGTLTFAVAGEVSVTYR